MLKYVLALVYLLLVEKAASYLDQDKGIRSLKILSCAAITKELRESELHKSSYEAKTSLLARKTHMSETEASSIIGLILLRYCYLRMPKEKAHKIVFENSDHSEPLGEEILSVIRLDEAIDEYVSKSEADRLKHFEELSQMNEAVSSLEQELSDENYQEPQLAEPAAPSIILEFVSENYYMVALVVLLVIWLLAIRYKSITKKKNL